MLGEVVGAWQCWVKPPLLAARPHLSEVPNLGAEGRSGINGGKWDFTLGLHMNDQDT